MNTEVFHAPSDEVVLIFRANAIRWKQKIHRPTNFTAKLVATSNAISLAVVQAKTCELCQALLPLQNRGSDCSTGSIYLLQNRKPPLVQRERGIECSYILIASGSALKLVQ